MKRLLPLLLAAALLAASLAGCATVEEDAPALMEPVGVKTDSAAAYIGEISKITVYDSAVVPHVEELYFTIDGVVETVGVVPGQAVKKGEALISLDESDAREKYDSAFASYEYARKCYDYDNALSELDIDAAEVELIKLKADGASSRDVSLKEVAVESLRLSLEQARQRQALEISSIELELETLRAELGKNVIYAPFDGCVAYGKQLEQGSSVKAYSGIIYLADNERLSLSGAYISESVLRGASEVYALVGAHKLEVTPVPIDQSEYITTVLAGGTVTTQFTFDDVAPEDVEAGMYAAICVVSKRVNDALLVPANALLRDAQGRYVYVYDGETRVRRSVTVGVTTDWLAQITSGLEEGEVVYVSD